MTDGVNVDFGLLKPPNYVADYVNAFKVGQSLQQQQALAGAGNPSPAAASADQEDTAASLASMSASQRQQAVGRTEMLASMLAGLRGASTDPMQRLAMARHIAARNPSLGIAPSAVSPADVTDAGLEGHLVKILALRGLLTGTVNGGPESAPSDTAGFAAFRKA